MIFEPLGLHAKWRTDVQDVRVFPFLQVWSTILGTEKCASGVDAMHEIIAFHGGVHCACQMDSTCIVDKDINTAKLRHGLIYSLLDSILPLNVHNARETLAPCLLHCFSRCVDGAWEFWMGLCSFC